MGLLGVVAALLVTGACTGEQATTIAPAATTNHATLSTNGGTATTGADSNHTDPIETFGDISSWCVLLLLLFCLFVNTRGEAACCPTPTRPPTSRPPPRPQEMARARSLRLL